MLNIFLEFAWKPLWWQICKSKVK